MNGRELVGLCLVALGAFVLIGGVGIGLSWVLGYWDKEYVETYRGYDIYFFFNIGVYGFQTGGGEWRYFDSVESAENAIDDMLDQPIFIETYRGYEIYQSPGTRRYYAVDPETGEQVSTYWTELEGLKSWLDTLETEKEETLEAEVEGHVYTSPGPSPGEVEVQSPERRLGWLRWLGLPLMALGAVLALRRDEKER